MLSSAQSSFTAIIGTVFCILLFAVALTYVNLSASLVSERFAQQDVQRLAILLSNDLLLNPGYENYHGLALYSPTTHSVQEHVLDSEKLDALAKALSTNPKTLNDQWTIDSQIALNLVNLDSSKQILDFGSTGKNAVTIHRLVLMEGDHVLVRFTLS